MNLIMPMVVLAQFEVGSHWTWTYYTSGDLQRPYSAERYEVIAQSGTTISFEISSRYDANGAFTPNTRFTVDLAKCHAAFRNPDTKVNFLISLYPRINGTWERTPIRTEATAFEEKFNCNPVHHTRSHVYETRFSEIEWQGANTAVFQQWPKYPSSQLRSYYFAKEPGLEGVAVAKEFNPGSPDYYLMTLSF